jgi:hypothetical protein
VEECLSIVAFLLMIVPWGKMMGMKKKMVAFVGWQELKKLTFSMNDALSLERDKRIFNDLQQ